MARHANRVKVYSRNGNVIRHIGYVEALSMLNADPPEATRLSRLNSPQLVIQLRELEQERRGDACTITFQDMQSNAGEAGPRREGSKMGFGNHVDQTMFKIEQWPLVGDTLTPRVSSQQHLKQPCSYPRRLCDLQTVVQGKSQSGRLRFHFQSSGVSNSKST